MRDLLRYSILPFNFFLASFALAQDIALDLNQPIGETRTGWLPYGFSTDSMGTTLGIAAFTAGKLQPTSSLFLSGYASSNDSWGVVGAGRNIQIPGADRFFFDAFLFAGHFTDSRYYVDLDGDAAFPAAGSNDSKADDFVSGVSNDAQMEATVKYVIPIGDGVEHPLSIYRLNQGLLATETERVSSWNPFRNGKTTVETSLFGRYQDLAEVTQPDLLMARTNGLSFKLAHDHTDFARNPVQGSRQSFTLSRDFGWFGSSDSWTNLQLDVSKFTDLGSSHWFRQRVAALNFWTSHSPTWRVDNVGPRQISHRPPPYMGSTLGGYNRLRAYPSGRFNDKSAVYYSGELRLMPKTGSLRDYRLLSYFDVDWIQLAPFVEMGRTAPTYERELFFEDLKYSVGIDLRVMAFRNVLRIGWSYTDEGNQIWAMVGQPFSR